MKGPGDRLSPKQLLWLDYLHHQLHTDAEVCHVRCEFLVNIKVLLTFLFY